MNLASVIADHPADAPAVVSRGQTTTYGALRAHVGALAGGLTELGVRPGDRVAVLCGNNWYFVSSYLATMAAGAIAVPLNPLSPAEEVVGQLAAVDTTALVVGPAGRRTLAEIDRDRVPSLKAVVAPGEDVSGAVPLETLLDREPASVVDRGPDDLAVLAFTSGTAGSPKAAMLTHGNLLANHDQLLELPARQISPEDVAFGVLPLSHIFGLNVVLGLTLRCGASVVLEERFDPASSLESIRANAVTIVAGAPPMWAAWAALTDARRDAFASVRLAISGASALPDEVAGAFADRYGLEISEGYGLTEAAPTVTSTAGEPRRGSIGRPLPGIEVRLVDADGHDALVGDAGEVWVRGANVFRGYWQDEDATAAVLTGDGWLRTGDVAVADDEGYLHLVDRVKDLVIVSGFNVFPAEVEDVLEEHPAVSAAAVVGVEHPHTGEAVKAFVVVGDSHVEEEELELWCRDRLARYKCPSKIEFVAELPRGASGKVLRRELRPTG